MMKKDRKYLPGSEWVYFKIYTGYKTGDDLLIKKIFPLLKKYEKLNYIDKFFFIRYADPNFHLRIRMHLVQVNYLGEILIDFNNNFSKLLKDNTVWKIQTDTYVRELERYNFNLIDQVESFFHIDSIFILEILSFIRKKMNNNDENRWLIGLSLIDNTLNLFHDDDSKKFDLMFIMSESFKNEFGFNKHNSKQFNERFRAHKEKVEKVMNYEKVIEENDFTHLYKILEKRRKALLPIVLELKKNQIKYRIEQDMISDLIHMVINRLIPAKNRLHELLLYDFAKRYYSSIIARKMDKKL